MPGAPDSFEEPLDQICYVIAGLPLFGREGLRCPEIHWRPRSSSLSRYASPKLRSELVIGAAFTWRPALSSDIDVSASMLASRPRS